MNADESLEAFGQHLRTARLRRGLTQASVAAMAGVSLRTLQKLEGGEPGVALRTAAAVMAALGFGTPFGELCAPKDDETGRLLDLARIPKRGAGFAGTMPKPPGKPPAPPPPPSRTLRPARPYEGAPQMDGGFGRSMGGCPAGALDGLSRQGRRRSAFAGRRGACR